jgi:AraC-like DNA-binding protein
MKIDYGDLERRISDAERVLGLKLTVIDRQGRFHTPAGLALFPVYRQSHRKEECCLHGFRQDCVEHCRHEMGELCEKRERGFAETCWKGVTQLVVPLRREGTLLGMLYAGSWRKRGAKPPETLPRKFHKAFEALPEWDERRGMETISLLELLAAGLLRRLDELAYEPGEAATRVGRAISYIRQNAARNFGVEDLGEALELSRASVGRLLKEKFGRGLSALLREERVRRVKTLLSGSSETLAEIAKKTGFGDEYHLCKVFKRECGMTPGAFRRAERQALLERGGGVKADWKAPTRGTWRVR